MCLGSRARLRRRPAGARGRPGRDRAEFSKRAPLATSWAAPEWGHLERRLGIGEATTAILKTGRPAMEEPHG
jgi:hypothetical protein